MRLIANFLEGKNRARREAIIIGAATLIVWVLAHFGDGYERLTAFVVSHEDWELDELILALMLAGVAGHVYAGRRLWDLRRESNARLVAESKARWIAYHDYLTRLPNRRFLEERAQEEVEHLFPDHDYTVHAIDLDGFKKINDLIGHAGGDALLVQTAERLTELFPNGLVFRLGGDEFLAICRRRTPEDQERFSLEVVETLTAPMIIENSHAEVGACIGFATAPQDGSNLKDLAELADMALYSAKRTGRNMVRAYDTSMKEEMSHRAAVENRLRQALQKREITPFYQPLVDLQTGEIRAFEALARWHDQQDGFISPDIFISMAEDIGLIMDLTEQLLLKACEDATTWPSNIQLAVNLSPKMMIDRLLGIRIIRVLGQTGLAPQRLEIEITESALIADLDLAKTVIRDLRNAGIKVVLDDFGTGYSSLSQLSNLYFDKIKIDKSFVATFQSNDKQMNIVRTVVALGKGLGITITAEGIENASQMEALKQLGCRYGQGYLIGKAMPQEQVHAHLAGVGPQQTDTIAASSSGCA